MSLPSSWTEALDRLAVSLGAAYPASAVSGGAVEAEAWLREAVEVVYGVPSLHDLSRDRRAVAFQKISGVVLAADEDGIPAELFNGETGTVDGVVYRDGTITVGDGGEKGPGRRERVARLFARYFEGVALQGPPWRLSETETDRPTYTEWTKGADFG